MAFRTHKEKLYIILQDVKGLSPAPFLKPSPTSLLHSHFASAPLLS